MRFIPHDPYWTRLALGGSCERLDPDLVVRRFTVPLPGSLDRPFRLAFFSDLHWDGEPARRFQRLVESVKAAAVDVVLFGGDLAAYLLHLPDALSHLATLRAGCACIAVRGNRESACTWLQREFWRERYGQAGFVYLENEVWAPAQDPGAPAIVGLDDERHGVPDLGMIAVAAQDGRTVVSLTHNPDLIGDCPGTFLGHLVLSGHTHGGQYRVPGLGALFTSSRFWRQFDQGWRRHRDGALLYITSGAGETGAGLLRRRIFCPPELVLLTLVSASPGGVADKESV
jgi:predicted MPP superfamily phosphohydrolase